MPFFSKYKIKFISFIKSIYLKIQRILFKLKNFNSPTSLLLKDKYNPKALSDKNSILVYCHHKAASTFVSKMLSSINNNDLVHIDLSGYLSTYQKNIDDFENHEDFFITKETSLFLKKGHIYGPLRKPINTEYINQFKSIYFIRDPRDSIISYYYSMAYSHPLPEKRHSKTYKRFLDHRENLKKMNINDFASSIGKKFYKQVFSGFINQINSSNANSLIIKYEDLRENTDSALRKIESFMDIRFSKEDIEIFTNEMIPNEKIRKMSHKRSGLSKQYIKELDIKTIEFLNTEFRKELEFFKYET